MRIERKVVMDRTSTYAMVFSHDCSDNENVLEYVKKQVQRQHLNCDTVSHKDLLLPGSGILVTATFDRLAKQAEDEQMEKQLADENGYYRKFSVNRFSDFKGYQNKNTFFTPAEEGRLLHNLLQSVSYEPEILKGFGFHVEHGKLFLDALEDHSKPVILESTFLLHETDKLNKINKQLWASFLPWKELSVNTIRDYFGEDVALYFAWMKFFGAFLCYSSIAGLIMYILRPGDASIDNDPYVPLFSLFMAVWGVLFLIFWQRKCSEHTFHWHSYQVLKKEELRSEFYGNVRPHPVTGMPMIYFPHWKRQLRYLFSLLVTIPVLLLGVLVMILSLNLNGYIKDKDSPVYISYLAAFAEPVCS